MQSKLLNININANTYLGPKGYTILKKDLSLTQQNQLKEELMVKPYVHGSPVNSSTSFPAYRESSNKIYVPRYFGEERFGKPATIKISDGDNIDVPFAGKLRDYQEEVVNSYIQKVYNNKDLGGGGGLIEIGCGKGKTVCA